MKLIVCKIFFLFLLTAKLVKKSHIYDRIFFIFLKNVIKQTFDTQFQLQWKDQKSIYTVKQSLALFCNLTALILG